MLGPAALVVSAFVALGTAAATVAEVNEYYNLLNGFDALLNIYERMGMTLGALTDENSTNGYNRLILGSNNQMLFGMANLVAD